MGLYAWDEHHILIGISGEWVKSTDIIIFSRKRSIWQFTALSKCKACIIRNRSITMINNNNTKFSRYLRLGQNLADITHLRRVEICRDRHDRRLNKICSRCVNFPGKQRDFLHNLCTTTRFTHTICDFALKLLIFYALS